jgi:hypothetical protein
MRIVSQKSAKAINQRFVPVPAESDRIGDFASCSSGPNAPGYLRALNLNAHEWLLQHGGRGAWFNGRLRLPEWVHYRRQIIFLARSARFVISRSELALPPERPQLTLLRVAAARS